MDISLTSMFIRGIERVKTFISISSRAWGLFGSMVLVCIASALPASADRFPETADYLRQSIENLLAQGEIETTAGDFSGAMLTFKKARVAAIQGKNEMAQVDCLMKLGEVFWNLGDIDKSETTYKDAEFLATRSKYQEAIGKSRLAQEIIGCYQDGKKYCGSFQYQKAIDCYSHGIRLSRKLGCLGYEAKCLRKMSIVYYEQNKMKEFLELNQKALQIYQKIKNERETGYCFYNIGVYFEKTLELPLALLNMSRALAIAKTKGIFSDRIDCLLGMGNIYLEIGNYNKANAYFMDARKLIDLEPTYYNLRFFLGSMGCLFRKKAENGDEKRYLKLALDNYYDCLSLCRREGDIKNEVQLIVNISFALIKLKKHDEALRVLHSAFLKAHLLNDPSSYGQVFVNEGHAFLGLKWTNSAIECFKRALDSSSRRGAENWLWEAYWGLGKCLENKNEISAAETSFRSSIALIERTRDKLNLESDKADFVWDKLAAYESLVHLLFKEMPTGAENLSKSKIFSVIERAKSRVFLEILQGGEQNSLELMPPESRAKERDISLRISSLMRAASRPGVSVGEADSYWRELGHWEEEYELLMDRIGASNGRIFKSEPIPLAQVQAFLRERKTAVLEYFLGDEQSYLTFLTGNHCDIWSLPAKSDIENSVKVYIKMLSSPPQKEYQGGLAAQRLFKELLFPLRYAEDKGIENLVIIPDGLLYYLPFETLTEDSSERSRLGRCVLEDYCISYAPSVNSLYWISKGKEEREPAKALLAFGNPNYNVPPDHSIATENAAGILRSIYLDQGFSFFPLPHTQDEVLDVSRFFIKSKADIFLGENASEGALKRTRLTDYRIIHFACHGFLDERFPMRSALVLSPTSVPYEDGFLQAREINNLKTQADLVVLSACQTARGSLVKGEGPLGLTRAFFYMGAKSVVSALWPISDQSTSIIMQYFYSGLARGLSKSQALREAKIKMLRSEYSHPFYWAAFILNGDFASSIKFH